MFILNEYNKNKCSHLIQLSVSLSNGFEQVCTAFGLNIKCAQLKRFESNGTSMSVCVCKSPNIRCTWSAVTHKLASVARKEERSREYTIRYAFDVTHVQV